MDKLFASADVKAAGDGGEFEAVASMPVLDRDGEIIDAGAFEPLPESVPVHAYHSFGDPVGVGEPFYEGEQLMIRGTFATTPRAQEMRQLVLDGAVPAVSVGFMTRNAQEVDGVRHITSAELLEVSLVSVPALREAQILAVKSVDIDLKRGARNSEKDSERLQQIHELVVANGAVCATADPKAYTWSATSNSTAATITKSTVEPEDEETSTPDEDTEPAEAAEEAATPPATGTDDDGEDSDDLELRAQAIRIQAEAVA